LSAGGRSEEKVLRQGASTDEDPERSNRGGRSKGSDVRGRGGKYYKGVDQEKKKKKKKR